MTQNETGNKNTSDLSFQQKLESSSLVTRHLSLVTNYKSLVTHHCTRGRSMIEMLGVLAVIGILSIGALSGIGMAMARYRANEVLDFSAKLSITIQTGPWALIQDTACVDAVSELPYPAAVEGNVYDSCVVVFGGDGARTEVSMNIPDKRVRDILVSHSSAGKVEIVDYTEQVSQEEGWQPNPVRIYYFEQ